MNEIELNIVEEDGYFFGFRGEGEVEKAHRAFEAQLKHTMNMIKSLEGHPHFVDDCGDYLFAALELSADMMSPRQNGPEDLHEWMVNEMKVWVYATDGVAEEVYEWAREHGKAEEPDDEEN